MKQLNTDGCMLYYEYNVLESPVLGTWSSSNL